MTNTSKSPRYFSAPKLRDLIHLVLLAAIGALLGFAINAVSPRGFDMKMAAVSSAVTKP